MKGEPAVDLLTPRGVAPAVQRVTLLKTDDTFGRLRYGSRQSTAHSAELPRDRAIAEAYRDLLDWEPTEQPACWTVIVDQEGTDA